MRCVSSLSMLVATALLATAVPRATADRVLVVGADASLLHDRIQAESNPQSLLATFSPAGLAQLAMDAFGLATGNVVWLSSTNSEQVPQISVKSPLQADVFSKVNAYAMVFVDRADADVLAGVDATAKAAYHTSFDLEASTDVTSTKIPSVLAKAIAKARGTVDIQCAGTDTVCTGGLLAATHVAEADVDSVLSAHSSFLEPTVDADRTFARELAQTLQITQAIRSARAAEVRRALYVASFSSVEALSEDKRPQAREVLANQIQQLLAALQTAYPKASGAQIVATTPTHAVRALDSTIAYSRMLTSFKDKVAGSLDDDDDDNSGSSDDDENATTSDVNMEDIAEYQIVLWTSVLLGGALLLVIIAMCNMEPKRDSLLYAKFTTSNAGRKFD